MVAALQRATNSRKKLYLLIFFGASIVHEIVHGPRSSPLKPLDLLKKSGGDGGIRTLDTLSSMTI